MNDHEFYRVTTAYFCAGVTVDREGNVVRTLTAPILRKFPTLMDIRKYYEPKRGVTIERLA